jgi:cytochrome c-type biogenesis protein CcmH/NrfG
MGKKTGVFFFLVLINAIIATGVYALGTSSSSWPAQTRQDTAVVSYYDQGVQANKDSDFVKAKSLFEQALQENPNNPDILNMLAHTQLKLGMIDQSLETYKRALVLRPRFPEAREYLGEAYIRAAKRELDTIHSYGSDGKESGEDLTKVFKETAAQLK